MMKSLLFSFIATLACMFSCIPSTQAEHLNSYHGVWHNTHAVIPQLEISTEGAQSYIRAWYQGEPSQDLGVQSLVSNPSFPQSYIGTFEWGDKHIIIQLLPNGKELKAVIEVSTPNPSGAGNMTTFSCAYQRAATPVSNATTSQMGSISGKVVGQASSMASIFQISLYGPDNGRQLRTSQPLTTDKNYKFENLPDGTYWMLVESKGSTIIQAIPELTEIIILDGKATFQDVELR
ncbi:carboxypeptidase-like regulatory domain-containing protein [Pontibacter sp. G13]|uniref:carboxypeptidase-like regulatory domain-containing protein n=1 Tax=Pontibacter sp. G13 TaxID=3074898 RepID=UPI002889A058|nr:carboxypeptidase-like regulatory domain-containing protein [Pontibacter sp. G13]WNJ18064.1 carboxypeptidase-like regulatory domain-containing protein [Pontibacter sp. G13]